MTANSGTSSFLNSSSNDQVWQSTLGVPSGGAPDIITVDLTPVTSSARQSIVFNWLSQASYGWTVTTGNGYGCPVAYTLQTNTAAGGGAAPTTGWSTVITETANIYQSRQYTLNTAGVNWVRMVITAIKDVSNAQGTHAKIRIYTSNPDANGLIDGIAYCGDSITANTKNLGSISTISVLSMGDMIKAGGDYTFHEIGVSPLANIHIPAAGYDPLQENHGVAGTTSLDWVTTGGNGNNLLAGVLAVSKSRYVMLALGTNDGNGGVTAAAFTTNMLNLVSQCIAANRIPIVPRLPWASASGYAAGAVRLVAAIDTMLAAHPEIMPGPDFYGFFSSTNWLGSGQNNQTWITTPDAGGLGGDGIHPNTVGSAYMRAIDAQWFASNIYSGAITRQPAVSTFNGTIKVSGNKFVDGAGNQLFIRWANYAGYEFAAIGGFGNPDASGAQAGQANGPNVTAAATNWKLGGFRIPINASSWFGTTVYDVNGNTLNPDPSGTYRAQIDAQIAALTGAGHYAILDLHWINVGKVAAAGGQMAFPDSINGPAFWTNAATRYKNNPAVMFDLFNEPIVYNGADLLNGYTAAAYTGQQDGNGPVYYTDIYPYPVGTLVGTFTPGELFTATGGISGRIIYHDTVAGKLYLCSTTNATPVPALSTGAIVTGGTSGAHAATTGASSVAYAGYQSLLNAVRATGATNVCLIGGMNFSSDLSTWLANAPTDPTPAGFSGTWVPQIAASYHCYPDSSNTYSGPYGTTGTKAYGQPNYGPNAFINAQAILNAGYPLMMTETGGETSYGSATANNEPFCANTAAWCGTYNVSTSFWAWDIFMTPQNVCITSVSGAPTVGQGQVQQAWALSYSSRYGT